MTTEFPYVWHALTLALPAQTRQAAQHVWHLTSGRFLGRPVLVMPVTMTMECLCVWLVTILASLASRELQLDA